MSIPFINPICYIPLILQGGFVLIYPINYFDYPSNVFFLKALTCSITSTTLCTILFGLFPILSLALIRGLPSYHHISMQNVWKMLYHHFTLTTYQLKCQNLHIVHRIQNLQKYLHIFWEVRLLQPCLSQKAQKIEIFYLSPFWNLNFGLPKDFFF